MWVVSTDAYGVSILGDQRGDRFGRVSLRVDHDEEGNPTPLHRVVFPGMAIASERRFPGCTVYLTPRWSVVLGRFRWHDDNWSVGALRVFPSLEALRRAVDAAGDPLCPPEVIAMAEQRLAQLYGRSIPNDFDALPFDPAADAGSAERLDV